MKRDNTVGFRSLRLEANCIPELQSFYGGLLGLETRLNSEGLEVQAGSTRLQFSAVEGTSRVYHFAFNIPENQLGDAQKWLSARTWLVERDGSPTFDFASWNAHATYFFDPAGNIAEVIARHSLHNASDEPFGPQSIPYVSELGLVVDDVPSTIQAIEASLGMKPYREPAQDFAAVGDEYALLILAQTGRVWFGTDGMKAERHPAAAEIWNVKGTFAQECYRIG